MEFITNIHNNNIACDHAMVTSFKHVTIFGDNYTKIVYMHSDDDYTIERVDPEENQRVEDVTQVVSGPRASEIIQTLLENEKKRGATFVWTGVHFRNNYHKIGDEGFTNARDPLAIDPVQPEVERRKHRRRKEDQND